VAEKVESFLTRALAATGDGSDTAQALVPWICDALLSNHSVKAYGQDFMHFVRHMQAHGVTPLAVSAAHVKLYKRALLEAKLTPGTVARRLSVLRGAYEQLAAKGLMLKAVEAYALVLKEEDAEVAARRIQIRLARSSIKH
jgi:site-specific recombinase XerD